LPATDHIDGVPVYRIGVDVRSRRSKTAASLRLVRRLLAIHRDYAIVHLHGFSQKNVPITAAARALGKKIVLTLHTAGQDEPDVVRRGGAVAYRPFAAADLVMAVSPGLRDAYAAAVPDAPIRLAPNGVDLQRFRPADDEERLVLRRALDLPANLPVILFVGFFSRDKRPDVAFRAWQRLWTEHHVDAALVFVGATEPTYREIDSTLAGEIRARLAADAPADRVVFVPPTTAVDRYFRAATLFVLPSAREANPVALLEAMACALPCVASRLPGATDAIVDDGVNGLLTDVDDVAGLAAALALLIGDPDRAGRIGARARAAIETAFDSARTAYPGLEG